MVRNMLEELTSGIFSWAYPEYRPTGDTWWLAYELSKTLLRNHRYRDAEIFLRWEFLEATKALNAEHPKCLAIAHILTKLLLFQERNEEAKKWYQWLLSSQRRVLSKTDVSTLTALTDFGRILVREGKYEMAFQALLAIYQGTAMPECIGKAPSNQTRAREALEWFQHIFEVQKTLGQEHMVFLNIAYAIGIIPMVPTGI